MSELCFVIVDGITESLSRNKDDLPTARLLRGRFPQSHYHWFDTFPIGESPTGNDILEEKGKALLKMLVQCPDCSTTYQGTQAAKGFTSIKGPIVFIGHDIGGSVIKRALVFANENWPSWRIAETTLAIFFFGGLHRSSESYSWEKQLINLVSISRRDIPTIFPLLHSLSIAQATTAQRFLPIAASYNIFNVFEDSDLAAVPKFSATFNSLAENFGVQCNHRDGHRDLLPREESSPTLKWILRKIESLSGETSPATKEYLRFLQQLMPVGLVARQQENLEPSPVLACIKKLESYKNWIGTAGFSLLHIHGPPGSGVAVFTSNIVLLYGNDKPEADTYYLDFSFHGQHMWSSSEKNMICSLAHQLLLQRPGLFQHMQPLCSWIMEKRCTDIGILWALFKSLLSHMSKVQVLLTIRDVQGDNVSIRVTEIITRVLCLCGITDPGIKVIITSNSSDRVDTTASNVHQVLVKDVEFMSRVMKGLVQARVQRLLRTRPAWRLLDEEVTDICWGAEGDYDWAMAKVQDLEMRSATVLSTKTALSQHIKSVPEGNGEFIQWVFSGISPKYATWLKEALRWVVFALRPLTSRELAVAVAFSQYENESITEASVQEFEARILSDLPGDINRIAGYLVKVNCGRVETTNNGLESFLVHNLMPNSSKEHAAITGKCLEYITWAVKVMNVERTKSPRSNIGVEPAYDLLEYAAHHWSFHYRMAGNRDVDIDQPVKAFLEDSGNLVFLSSILDSSNPTHSNPSILTSRLSTYATFGLDKLIKGHLPTLENVGAGLDVLWIQDAMKLAIERGHSEVALTLFQTLRKWHILPPLHATAAMGNLRLLKEYLQDDLVKQSINHKDSHGYTPLFYATQHGQVESVALLLNNDSEPNIINRKNWTALHVASKIGSFDISRLLIDHQADYKMCNEEGHSALHLAAEGGFDDLVAFLFPIYTEGDGMPPAKERTSTPLHLAAMYGHSSTCIQLIQYGAKVNAVDQENRTPVYLAVLGEFPSTVRALLASHSISPNVLRNSGTGEKEISVVPFSSISEPHENEPPLSPLQLAAERGYIEIIRLLHEYLPFDEDFTYDLNQALSRAAAAGQWRSIEILLDYSGALNGVDANGDTALHVACQNGQNEVINNLLQSKRYTVDYPNKSGLSCLHVSAEAGHADVVQSLINWRWTDIDIKTTGGDKAMHTAAKAGQLSVVKVLQAWKKDMIAEKNGSGQTPLLLAATAGHTSMVKELLSMMGSPLPPHEVIWGDSFPLHEAVLNEREEFANTLINSGYDVNTLDQDMSTPLHIAVGLTSESMTILLIRNHADPLVLNSKGETVLIIAAKLGKVKMCRIIAEMFAEKTAEFVNLKTHELDSALFSACNGGYKDVVQLLLKHGADPNQDCKDGWTSLHASASRGRTEIMQILLDSGAKHDVTSTNGSTPIILAAGAGHGEAVRLLFKNGARADIMYPRSSALHRAAQYGHLECVRILVAEVKVDVDIKNPVTGLTPLHVAILTGMEDVVQYLIEARANVNPVVDEEIHTLYLALWKYENSAMADTSRRILEKLIAARATMAVDSILSQFREDAVVFILMNPEAFSMKSPAQIFQNLLSSGYRKAASILFESNIDVNETGGRYHTALQAAAAADSSEYVEKLLQKNADPNLTGGYYTSALNAAVVRDNEKTVELLLKKKAKTDVEHDGLLPLQRAIRQGSVGIIRSILDAKGDPTIKDKNGRTIFAYAIHHGYKAVTDYLLTRSDIPIDDPDLCQQTPLMTAVILEKPDLVKKLLGKNADPNARDSEKKTPLIRAVEASRPNVEIIKALLAHQADPMIKDCRNRGALYWACLGAKINIIEDMIIPALKYRRYGILEGEFAFHAVASINATSTRATALKEVQMDILDRLLHSWLITEDLGGEDANGWTSIYTATRFGSDSMAENLVRYLILFASNHNLGNPKKPTGWHREDKAPCLEVDEIGTSVTVKSEPLNPKDQVKPHSVIRANHPMPGDKPYYFEVTIEEDAHENVLGIGFCEEHVALDRMLGWDSGSWGYHGDDGRIFGANQFVGSRFDKVYGKGDTVGCGVNFDKETAFFTKNGELIGPAFQEIRGRLYPAVCFRTSSLRGSIKANFGSQEGSEFQYKDWESERNTMAMEPIGQPEDTGHLPVEDGSWIQYDSDADLEWSTRSN